MGRIYKNGINYSGGVVPNSNSGFYSNNVYLSNTASDVSTYKILSYVSDSVEIEKSLTINSSQGEQLCEVYLYPTSIGISTIDSGMWTTNFTTKISSTAGGSTTMRFECFVRHIDNSETVLFTETSIPITSVAYASLISEVSRQVYTVTTTDRLGFKVYVTTTRSQDTTLSYIIGNGRASLFTMPLPLRHSQLRNKNEESNYQHITTAEKTDLKNPTFTEATTLANINSGESASTLWGKVKKMFSFIGTTALTTTATTITTAINELAKPTFTTASTLANIASGESQAMLWGKVNGMFSFIGTDITRLAPNYSASSYYGVGAFVINNNKLYRCATKVSNYESFDATKWTAISLINYLADPMTNTATVEASYVAAGGGSLVKIGRNVELTLNFYNARPIPNGATVMSLPVGYKPAYGSKDFVLRSLNNPKIANKFTIGSDGVVVYTDNVGDIPTDSWCIGTISFLTNQ